MEITSKDKIPTEGNDFIPKNNSIIQKRIGYFMGDKEDKKIYQTGFFCNIPENSDKNKKSIFLLTTHSIDLCEFLEPEQSNKNGEPKESKADEKPPATNIKFYYDEGKKSLSIKDRKIYFDDDRCYYGFKINEEDKIEDYYEIEEQKNYKEISDVNYSGYLLKNGIQFCTIKGSKNEIKENNKENNKEDNKEDNKTIYCDFKEIKGDTIMKGGPVYHEDNYVIGILNGLIGNKGIVISIKNIREDIQNKNININININKNKKNYIIWIIIMILILLVFASVFFVLYFLKKNDKKTENGVNEQFINEILLWEKNYAENNYTDISEYIIDETSQYRICVYGAKAEKGGKGCVQCAESSFEKGAIIQYRLGGKTSGGEGGKNCGWTPKNAPNGAGLSWANYSNYFFIVAGGGGGNSGSGRQGGDCEQDGAGKYGGKGATKDKGGQGGKDNSPSGDGTQFKGGNGTGVKGFASLGQYCGGGGGDGYYGGGGGDWGDQLYDGAGGGGSNYCKNNDGISCGETLLNKYNYSSIKIYKKIK